jgi:hypothetical protein
MRAFNVYVRPLLEYAACVWSPYHASKLAQIERVQRSFNKSYLALPTSAISRLTSLGVESLELRRVYLDLILVYRIIFGNVDVNAERYFSFANSGYDTRGRSYKILLHYSRIDRPLDGNTSSHSALYQYGSLAATKGADFGKILDGSTLDPLPSSPLFHRVRVYNPRENF